MNPFFAFKIAVGIYPLHLHGYAFNSRLIAVKIIKLCYLIAMLFAISSVHAVKHAGPVLCFGSARARMQCKNCIVCIILTGKQRCKVHLLGIVFQLLKLLLYLRHRRFIIHFLRELNKRLHIIGCTVKRLQTVQLVFTYFKFFVFCTCFFRIAPKLRIGHFFVEFRNTVF